MAEEVGQIERIDKYTIFKNKQIGRGKYGVVVQASAIDIPDPICCKVNLKQQQIIRVLNNADSQRLAKGEMEILKSLKNSDNPYLIKIYDVFDNIQSSEIMIFMEYCKGGNLSADWNRRVESQQSYSLEEIKEFIQNIILAYRTLYDRKIIHGDIKPQNILLLDKGGFKLTDFGMGRIIEDWRSRFIRIGTPVYAAPQILLEDRFSHRCDTYSLGIILYQMTYMELPFKSMTMNDLMMYLRQIKTTPLKGKQPNIEGSPQELQLLVKLIEDMLLFDDNTRISWPDLFAHPFVPREVSEIAHGKPFAQDELSLTQQQQQEHQQSEIMQQCYINYYQQPQIQANYMTDDQTLIQKNGVSKKYDLDVLQLKSGIQGIVVTKGLQHFLNILLAKSMVCQDLLELMLTELQTSILPKIQEFYYNLLLTSLLGYQNKILINVFGIAFNHISSIAVKIQQLFDPDHLSEILTKFSNDQSPAWVQTKMQISSNLSASSKAFLDQENKIIQLFNTHQYRVGIDNFKRLIATQNKIEYGLYFSWFKFSYENDFKSSLPYVKNQTYPFAYIKFVALSEFFITLETEYRLNSYVQQSPFDIIQILNYDETQLRKVIEEIRKL